MPVRERHLLEECIGYHFRDDRLLLQALTHSSYANEIKNEGRPENYERLEYLGDAVLEMIASVKLFRLYETLPEGELTRRRASLVCEEALFERASVFSLCDYIFLGRGEEMSGGRTKPSIVSDVCEALIGAIYLDGGFAEAERFINAFVLNNIGEEPVFDDAKTRLQEVVQSMGKETPEYRLISESGPAHNKTFTSAVYLGERLLAEGSGKNKKASQQEAAKTALRVLCT